MSGNSAKTIIFCCNAYPPNFIGGAELVAHWHAKSLQKKGNNVVAFVAETYSEKPMYTCYRDDFDGLPVYRIRCNGTNFSADYINFKNKMIDDAFTKILNEYNPDIMHCHNIIGLSLGIIDIASARGIKVELTLHDYWGFCYKNTCLFHDGTLCRNDDRCAECMPYIIGDVYIPIFMRQTYFRLIFSKIDHMISPSKYLADRYRIAGVQGRRLYVIGNGVDVDRYAKIEHKKNEKLNMLYVGILAKHKGIKSLLEAVSLLGRKDVIVNLVGIGEETENLRSFAIEHDIDEQVFFHGRVFGRELDAFLSRADVSVMPSVWPENASVSIVESMASGISVIASDMGGNPEFVDHGETGFVYEAGNARALADIIQRFIDNPELVKKMGDKARAKMFGYSYDVQTDKLIELYKRPQQYENIFRKSSLTCVCGNRVCDDLSEALPKNSLLLDWLNIWDYDKIDMVIVLTNAALQMHTVKQLMKSGVLLIVPEQNENLFKMIKAGNCGLYYKSEQELPLYIRYLHEHIDVKASLKRNALRYSQN